MADDDCAVRELDLGVGAPLRIKEYTQLQDEAGAVVWDAGLVLSYFLAHQHALGRCLVSGRACVDLGSGTGVAGLAAARLGARSAALTDLPHLLPHLQHNIQANHLDGVCEALPLEWGNAEQLEGLLRRGAATPPRQAPHPQPPGEPHEGLQPQPLQHPEVLLASDVVYTAAARKALFATLAALLAPPPGAHLQLEQPLQQQHEQQQRQPEQPQRQPEQPQRQPEQQGRQQLQGLPLGPQAVSEAGSGCSRRDGEGGDVGRGQKEAAAAAAGDCGCRCVQNGGGSSCGNGSGCEGGMGHCGTLAVLCFEVRPGVEELPGLCAQHGLTVQEVPEQELHPDWRSPDIRLLLLRRSCSGCMRHAGGLL